MLTTEKQIIMLLNSNLADVEDKVKPLTISEWAKFSLFLYKSELSPECLINCNLETLLKDFNDQKITSARIRKLLQRGARLAFVLEKWLKSGLWILSRSDNDYPKRLKKYLGFKAPPLIYGFGNKDILQHKKIIACVGSRNTTIEEITFSKKFGEVVSEYGASLVSGSSKGIDETSMLGALENEGTAIGVVSDSLIKKASSNLYRSFIKKNDLVLISIASPEAQFNVGNAMQRNKYIYCLADAALVVVSGKTGGTITGALENIRNKWVKVFVKETLNLELGNHEIAKAGGIWIPNDIKKVNLDNFYIKDKKVEQTSLDF